MMPPPSFETGATRPPQDEGGTGHTTLAGTTVAAARRAVAGIFRDAGFDTPELDARLIVGHALGLDHAALASEAHRSLDAAEAAAVTALAERRRRHEPIARILGAKEFWGLTLVLGAAALVPRPESETVVEAALAAIDRVGVRSRNLRIADLGTGSGALLLALLSELPNATGIGTDRSVDALGVARANAARLGLGSRAMFVAGDFATAIGGEFDLVVSNPPYVRSADIAGLAPEVRDHDPRLALDGGSDGLAAYRAIAGDVRRILAPAAELVVEIGAGQMDVVTAVFGMHGLSVIAKARTDLAGIPRALAARPLP
jgi:release factor glutamine methyltransferase